MHHPFYTLVGPKTMLSTWFQASVLIGLLVMISSGPVFSAKTGSVELSMVDYNGAPVPCQVHLRNENGEVIRADDLLFWDDHFVCSGKVALELPSGRYHYEIERGPEYQRRQGSFDVTGSGRTRHTLRMTRIADLAAQGWYSGDLHVHRDVKDVPLLMCAEDLHVAPVITWWNGRNLWRGRDLPKQTLKTAELLDPKNSSRAVWADSAYRSQEKLAILSEKGYRTHLQRKGCRHRTLTEREKRGNHTRSKRRSRVEHVFGVQTQHAGMLILRSIGRIRAEAKIGLRNLAYNLDRYAMLKITSCSSLA